ncbi:4-hydroxy-3-methylbut-2-enyl diphosphate reductase [Lacihabitans soyangensis]|uniref:4-hydroxy-3-methylbut-2-enyl diphosphate reductase n=1 Tax=Lacihabitans soyangensis TaxID=869394 RepID=A0AAE3H093_9BACT|nr:4-hydroxy-3-methylbut-2-enyl diphosphate reductase [Lacihabitans soyangensis]MCP9761915.1 4-hydroxy-3-methylbut-2-enyl diphosphate reductase [Lacihabitans soyangensis]
MKTFEIPQIYRSSIIASIKEKRRLKDKLKKDFSPTVLDFESVKILIARHFGFCYGVENAVEIAYKVLTENEGKRIFLLSEMIHNPEVNADLLSRGVKFLMDTKGNKLEAFADLKADDIVIVPAFGTTIELQNELAALGINSYQYDTTCPFVEKVWNRAQQIGERGFSVIVHGKPDHEETRATFSHSQENSPTIVIKDMSEAELLAAYIRKEKTSAEFYQQFQGRFSEGFDPEKDLERFGVVNQTTMLASETQDIANYLKGELIKAKNLSELQIPAFFASTRDTLCYATNDNQDATYALMKEQADLAIVVGGYNSSNTTHLVELLETTFPTYFIQTEADLISVDCVSHFDIHTQTEKESFGVFSFGKKPTIVLTCGASCPDAVVETVLRKIVGFFEESTDFENVISRV